MRSIALGVAVLVGFALAATSVAADAVGAGWRSFTIVQSPDYFEDYSLVTPLPDGSIVFERRRLVYRRGASGREVSFAGNREGRTLGDGGSATAARLGDVRSLAVAPDGAVLIAADNLIRRVGTDGKIATVAGTPDPSDQFGLGGYGGDGGPATTARLCGPQDVSSLPDGGFLIADTGNNVIRRVSADGTISTVAGVPEPPSDPIGCEFFDPTERTYSGEGGPATAARLLGPGDVVAQGPGGFVFVDRELRRVDPAGTITTTAGLDEPFSLTGMPDGGYAVLSDAGVALGAEDGSLTRIGGGGDWPGELFRSRYSDSQAGLFIGDGRDARSLRLNAQDVAADPLGGGLLLSSGENSVSMLARSPAGRMGIAIRGVRPAAARRPVLSYVATAPGTLEMSVKVGNRRIGPIRRRTIKAGLTTVRLPRLAPNAYTLTVRAIAANGTRDSDRLAIVLGGRLPIWAAAQAIANFECDCTGDAPDTTEYLGRCRRMSRSRVDCRIDARELDTCEYVGSAVVRASGFVWTRRYSCPVRRKTGRASKFLPAPLL